MDSTTYRERLWPAWWVVLLTLLTVAMVAWAYGAAVSPAIGIVIAVLLVTLSILILWITSPRVSVSPSALTWGSMVLPRTALGSARLVDADEYRRILQLRAAQVYPFLAVRTWAGKSAVLIEVADAQDPHTHVLLSTRHPHELCQALGASSA